MCKELTVTRDYPAMTDSPVLLPRSLRGDSTGPQLGAPSAETQNRTAHEHARVPASFSLYFPFLSLHHMVTCPPRHLQKHFEDQKHEGDFFFSPHPPTPQGARGEFHLPPPPEIQHARQPEPKETTSCSTQNYSLGLKTSAFLCVATPRKG